MSKTGETTTTSKSKRKANAIIIPDNAQEELESLLLTHHCHGNVSTGGKVAHELPTVTLEGDKKPLVFPLDEDSLERIKTKAKPAGEC